MIHYYLLSTMTLNIFLTNSTPLTAIYVSRTTNFRTNRHIFWTYILTVTSFLYTENLLLSDNIHILTASYHGNIALLSFALFSVGYTGSVHPLNSSRNCNLLRELHHAWNGFPKQVVSSLMKRFGKPTKDPTGNNNLTETNVSEPTLWFEMPYIGQKGEQLLRGL